MTLLGSLGLMLPAFLACGRNKGHMALPHGSTMGTWLLFTGAL